MSEQFVDSYFKIIENINLVEGQLKQLSRAFGRTGNSMVSDELFDCAEVLYHETLKLRKICSDKLSHDLKQAQEMTGTILNSCLNSSKSTES